MTIGCRSQSVALWSVVGECALGAGLTAEYRKPVPAGNRAGLSVILISLPTALGSEAYHGRYACCYHYPGTSVERLKRIRILMR